MNLATHIALGARNLFRFNGRLAIARRSGLKSALLAVSLAFASPVQAQNAPHIGYVYPAGGRPASSFTVVIGGQFPSGITNFAVVMDGDWAQAKVVAYDRR